MESLNNIENPKVSVIISVYNVEEYLSEALDSVIAQTYKNIEIIVVDDCSSDGSGIICDEYAKKDFRIKVIHRKHNGGLSAARNTGLDNMSGDYVAFLDSDDAFSPEMVERTLNAILANEVDCVVFKILVHDLKNGNINKQIYPNIKQGIYSQKELMKAIACREINAAVWNKLFKSGIWDNLRFSDGHVYEDRYIIFDMFSKIKSACVLDDVLIKYKKRTGSITDTKSINNVNDLFNSLSVFENFIETHIPEMFDYGQLQQARVQIFEDYVEYYIAVLASNISGRRLHLTKLKEQIISMKNKIQIKSCRRKIRYAYRLVSNHSKLLSIFFPIIFKIYKAIKRISNLLFYIKISNKISLF